MTFIELDESTKGQMTFFTLFWKPVLQPTTSRVWAEAKNFEIGPVKSETKIQQRSPLCEEPSCLYTYIYSMHTKKQSSGSSALVIM